MGKLGRATLFSDVSGALLAFLAASVVRCLRPAVERQSEPPDAALLPRQAQGAGLQGLGSALRHGSGPRRGREPGAAKRLEGGGLQAQQGAAEAARLGARGHAVLVPLGCLDVGAAREPLDDPLCVARLPGAGSGRPRHLPYNARTY